MDQLVEPRSFVHVARAFVNNRQVGLLLDDFLVQHGIPDPRLAQATPGLTVQEANLSQRLAALANGNHNIDPQTLRGLRIFFEGGGFYNGSNLVTPTSSPANRPGPQNRRGGGGGAAAVPP